MPHFEYLSRFFSSVIFVALVFFATSLVNSASACAQAFPENPFQENEALLERSELPDLDGGAPVDLKIYMKGKLILQSTLYRYFEKDEKSYDPQKEWEMFLKSQTDSSLSFSPTTLFDLGALKESTQTKHWKILQPDRLGPVVRFSGGKIDRRDPTPQIQLHIGTHTIVLLPSLHLKESEAGWLVDPNKIAKSGKRFVQLAPSESPIVRPVLQTRPKPARPSHTQAANSNEHQENQNSDENSILETGKD